MAGNESNGKNKKPSPQQLKEKDLNHDGKINKADETLRRDTFSIQSLGVDYQTAARIIGSDQSLSDLFTKAVKERWTPDAFKAGLKNTTWAQTQGTEFAQKAWIAKQSGGQAWTDQLNAASEAIRAKAAAVGVTLPSDVTALAEKYLFGGWYDQARSGFLDNELSTMVDTQKGQASALTQALKDWAWQNGQKYDDAYYQKAAASVIAGDSSDQDWKNQISQNAAGTYPIFADAIARGQSVRSMASPYIKRMATLLELDENSIELNDPHLSRALGGVDDKGNPKAMNYFDFEENIRRDPRWSQTANGRQTLNDVGMKMLKDWGFYK